MYGLLWRHLPGPRAVRLLELAVLAVGVVALLFYVVFPAVDPHLPFNRVTVNDGPVQPSPTPAPAQSTRPPSAGG